MNAEDPQAGSFRQVAPILAGGVREQPLHHVRDADETDTEELLKDAGLSGDEIAKLLADGAVE